MEYHGQNQEDIHIMNYFSNQPTGTFLEIGGYNPFTFSNTRLLVEKGWKGIYVEPSPKCFESFVTEYGMKHKKVTLLNVAIGAQDGTSIFYDSKGDAISSTSIAHKQKWEAGFPIKYDEITVNVMAMSTLLNKYKEIDFLNLDVESTNIELFNLIPDYFWQRLKMICIEHDSQKDYIKNKLISFGFREIASNGENIILAK